MKTLDEKILDFVAESQGINRHRLTPDSTLFGDLGIDGADAWELMAAFEKEFQVDMSGFQANRYFGPEGGPPIYWLAMELKWLFRRIFFTGHPLGPQTPEERVGLKPIRIKDLIAIVKEGKWTLR